MAIVEIKHLGRFSEYVRRMEIQFNSIPQQFIDCQPCARSSVDSGAIRMSKQISCS